MKKTIGIFAHVDAGKTTLSEALLYECNAIRKKGSVNSADTVMDNSNIEKERGITCFSNVASFRYGDDLFYLIDTPGHNDFIADTERCMVALDCAVLIVDVLSGVKSNTIKLWHLLSDYKVPTFIFVNKCDLQSTLVEKTLSDINTKLSENAVVFGDDSYYSLIAESSERLLEQYFASEIIEEEYKNQSVRMISSRELFPILCGSAALGDGVGALLDLLSELIVTKSADGDLVCDFFKVKNEKDRRIAYARIIRGSIKVRDSLPNGDVVTELRISDGVKEISSQNASCGDIVGICGAKGYFSGDSIGKEPAVSKSIPLFRSSVSYPEQINIREMMRIFRLLEDEEPSLCVECNTSNNEISVCTAGEIALEVLKYQIRERFDIDVSFGKCKVIYKETISGSVMGYGHYEPLRHYAEVHLRIDEMPRGSGISFESEYPLDLLSKNYQNLIKTHIFEKKHKGVLVGAELTDVKFTLTFGKSHLKHTEGGDFRQATYRAVRQGLMKAENILLEPYSICRFSADASQKGRVISDMGTMSGEILEVGEEIVVRLPSAFVSEYQKEFNSFTKGNGIMSSEFDGYDIAHNSDEAIQGVNYDYKTDLDNTPDSIFCAHGAGFNVFWQDVEKYVIKE